MYIYIYIFIHVLGYNVDHMFGKIVRHLINQRYHEEEDKRKPQDNDGKKWWSKCQIL